MFREAFICFCCIAIFPLHLTEILFSVLLLWNAIRSGHKNSRKPPRNQWAEDDIDTDTVSKRYLLSGDKWVLCNLGDKSYTWSCIKLHLRFCSLWFTVRPTGVIVSIYPYLSYLNYCLKHNNIDIVRLKNIVWLR